MSKRSILTVGSNAPLAAATMIEKGKTTPHTGMPWYIRLPLDSDRSHKHKHRMQSFAGVNVQRRAADAHRLTHQNTAQTFPTVAIFPVLEELGKRIGLCVDPFSLLLVGSQQRA